MKNINECDVVGTDGRAIQLAIDAVAAQGGGKVRLAAGEFLLQDSVRLRPGVALMGVAGQTVLRRGPLVWSKLAIDADKSETQATPVEIAPWRVGMGVCMFDRRSKWAYVNKPYRITAIQDGTLQLDGYLTEDRWAEDGGIIVNYFPMLLGMEADGASAEGLVIDAAVEDPGNLLAGLNCHAVYVWRSRGVHLSHLVVRNALGDGITCADASVGAVIEDCEVCGNFNFGIHPGSHSADCVVRRCNIHDNGSDGLYICWGIRRGQFTDNVITHNGVSEYRSGICIGHKDTDCLIARNRIVGNRKHGIAFRRKTLANSPHRAIVRDNTIEDNGSPLSELADIKATKQPYENAGCGIHIEGNARDLVIEGNRIRETRSGADRRQCYGIVIEAGATVASLKGNVIEGHPDGVIVDRS